MKIFNLLLFLVVVHFQVKSQNNNVGIGTLNPDPSAILELQSSSKGFKLPTVNSPGAILNPVEGLLVFSDTDKKLFIYSNGQWTPFISSNNLFANQIPSLSSSGYLQPSGIISDPILGINLYSMIIKSDKIGIRNGSAINFIPDELFHVDGKTKTNQLQIVDGAGNGRILQSDANGNASWTEPNTIPLQETDPQVNVFVPNLVPRNSGLALIDGTIHDDGTKIVIGNDFFSDAKLSVTGKTKTNTFQMTEGASVNKVMTSDNFGNASWNSAGTVEIDPQVSVPSHLINAVPKWNGTTLVEGMLYDNGTTVQVNGDSSTGAPPSLTVIGTTQMSKLRLPNGASTGAILRSIDAAGTASWVNPSSIQTLEIDPQVLCLVPGKVPRFNGTELIDGLINDYGTSVEIGTNLMPNQFFKVYGTTEINNLTLINGAGNGHILTSDAFGNASWAAPGTVENDPQVSASILNTVPRWTGTTLSNGVIKDDNANVGIGTDPVLNQKLTVSGKTTTTDLQILSGAGNNKILRSDATGNASWVSTSSIESDPQVSMTNTNYFPVWNGTTLVDAIMGQSFSGNTVVVEGNVEADTVVFSRIKMSSGAGLGKTLESDAAGYVAWVPSKVSSTVTNMVPRWNGTSLTDGTIQDNATNVGIGIAPVTNQKLTVNGKTTTTNLQMTTGANNGFVLQSDSQGNASWVNASTLPLTETDPQVTSSTNNTVPRWNGNSLTDGTIQDNATNVGIGTAPVANQKLTVDGKTVTTNLQMTSGAANGTILQSDASGNGTWVNSTSLSVTETDPQVSSSATNTVPRWNGTSLADGTILDNATNVGIGTAPVVNQKLTVGGKTTTTNLQMTTGAANGHVLQSDANGNGTWVNANTLTVTETDPQVSSSSTNTVPRWNGTALADGIIQDNATNIGIGTAPVVNQKLTIAGKTTTTNLQMTSGAATGLVLQSDASGNSTWVNANTLAINNMYNTSGTLTSARTITQGSNALNIANNGTQNTTLNLSSTGDFDVQGNGTSAFKVQDDGKIGINQSVALAALHIKGIEPSFDSHIRLETAGGGSEYSNILYDGNMKFRNFGAGDEYQWRNSANNIRLRLFDNGDLTVSGNTYAVGLTLNPNSISLTINDQLIDVGGAGYFKLSSNTTSAFDRTIVLSDGLNTGQILFIESTSSGSNAFEILDDTTKNTNTSGTITMLAGDVIQLLWNGSDWLQVSYSNN